MPPLQASAKPLHTPATTPDFYLGDGLFVQPSLYRITKAGQFLQVGPKVMHVLVCLAEDPGHVVHRDDLMDAVWPDTHVVEEALTRCVSELRKIFDDDPKHPEIIETIRNVGYRLLVPVSDAGSSGDGALHTVPTLSTGNPTLAAKAEVRPSRALIGAGVLGLVVVAGFLGFQLLVPAATPLYDPLQPTLVTSYPGEERGGVLAPDGDRIAFSWQGESSSGVDIYVKGIGTEEVLQVTENSARDVSPAWSPDGKHVAFIRRTPGSGCTLVIVGADGTGEQVVGACGNNRTADLTWSPDGSWLAYSDRTARDTPSHIAMVSPDGQNRRTATEPPRTLFGDFDPSFSLDGRQLAFTRRASAETSDLYLIDLGSGNERRITFDDRLLRGHTWTPDGESIVFASNRAGTFALWRVPVDGGAPSWIAATGIEQARNPSMVLGSDRLVFENVTSQVTIRRLDLGSPVDPEVQPTALLVSSRSDLMPHYSPDGQRIAFISNRSGYFELWAAESDGTNPVSLLVQDGSVSGDPRWSPDGTEIAFSSLKQRQGDVYVVAVETGVLRQVTSAQSDDWVPRWSRDGRWIYFTSNRSGSWQIWKVAAEGGTPMQITQQGGRAAEESIDGRFLYVARSDTAGLWRMPAHGGSATLLLDRIAPFDWGSWAVFDDGLYYLERNGPESGISFFDFGTGEMRLQVSLPPASVRNITRGIPSLTISPDRKLAVYTQFDRKERDIMMVEAF